MKAFWPSTNACWALSRAQRRIPIAKLHEQFHPREEVYEVIEGELELTIVDVKQIAGPGLTRSVRLLAGGTTNSKCRVGRT